jgi:[ribosomal protein S5]-alanine N-acetyltransferase
MARREPEVELRPAQRADREEFAAAMRESLELHRPWISPPTSAAAFDALLERRRGEDSDLTLVRRSPDGALAGYFDLTQIVRGPLQGAFLGYGGVAALTGRGYMSAGLRLLLGRAFGALGLHRLEANIQPANLASIALVRRAGFVREGFSESYLRIGGRWRDHERWALRAEQWDDG